MINDLESYLAGMKRIEGEPAFINAPGHLKAVLRAHHQEVQDSGDLPEMIPLSDIITDDTIMRVGNFPPYRHGDFGSGNVPQEKEIAEYLEKKFNPVVE